MSRSWEEVKALLDDPYVDADTKEHLLAAYMREEGYVYGLGGPGSVAEDALPSEVREYYDQYELRDGDFSQGSLDDVYDRAEGESEERGYSARQNDDSVEDGRTTIDDLQPPIEGSTTVGAQKSDEIFDAARPALKLWQDFLPINDKVPSDTLGRHGKIRLKEDIEDRFNEQMGISFRNFMDDAARVRDAFGTLSELNTDTEAELNNLYKKWTGPAANASFGSYQERIAPNATDLLEYLETAPDMIGTAVTNIFTACKDKANDVIALYQGVNGTIGSATPDIANKVVELAAGNFNDEDWDKILEVAAWVDAMTGANLENTIRDDGGCSINDENRDYVIRECKKWIRDSFNADLHENLYVNFKQACDDALEAVNLHYETLNNYLKEYENEFGAADPGTTNPYQPQQPPPSAEEPYQQPPGTSTPPPSSSTPPPISTPPPSATPPPMPTPPGSTPPGSTPPGSTTPSGVPDLSALTPPGSTDPSSSTSPSSTLPGIGTPGSSLPGTPGAIDPVTGLPIPGGVPGSSTGLPGGGAPKEVTIKDGNRTITVGQPDLRGRSKVTVDDGEGEPREYEVDFTPDEPGETYEEDGVIKAGPDGKVVIQDGDAAITLEQVPGQSDQMKMTVDDGTPATYDFDFDAGTDVPSPGLPDVPTPGSMGGDGTSPGGVGGGGGGIGGGGGGGSFGGAETPGASTTPGPGAMVGAQAPDGGDRAGAAAAASAGGVPGGGAPGGGQGGAPMGGGMPMGGAGAGGGQGGDQARQSKWKTTGSLFDEQDPAANFSGVVGRDPAEQQQAKPKR